MIPRYVSMQSEYKKIKWKVSRIDFLDYQYGYKNNSNITSQKIQPDFNEAIVKSFILITVRIIFTCVHASMKIN